MPALRNLAVSCALLAIAVLVWSATRPLGAAPAEGARTLSGDYAWGGGPAHPIEATFTPAGTNSWDVEFRFTFQGRRNRWQGNAQGSLDRGPLAGTVREAGRTFRFHGKVADGVFRGRHSELHGGDEEEDTGTINLAPGD